MKIEHTLSVYTENQVGLLNKISIIFSRRKINLESFNSSPSEIDNIYRFTIVVNETPEVVKNLVRQIEKIVDVFKVFSNTNEEIIWQQMALYKVPTAIIMKEVKVERLLREYGAKAVVIREDYTVFEATGQKEEINKLLKELDKYIDSNDIAEYFKDHSYIDIFQLNNAIGLGLNPDIHEISIDILDNIYNIYLSQQNTYGISINTQSNSYLPQDIIDPIENRKSILKWASEEFLPQLVSELNLSPTKIHFLERIADYVNRGSHFLDKQGRSESDDERHVELTVRATELRASGVEPELIESFSGLELLHIQTASPKICEFIHSSEVASISFNGEVESLYICLEG
jgi:acetolactate synthase-1/3 small subunit